MKEGKGETAYLFYFSINVFNSIQFNVSILSVSDLIIIPISLLMLTTFLNKRFQIIEFTFSLKSDEFPLSQTW